MAKAPVIKFPRLEAGFYSITKDGEFVGYVMKEVDGKETNWYIFDDKDQGKDIAMLHPENAIDAPDALLREAKESAKNYFLNKPEAISPISPLKVSEWVEEKVVEETSLEDSSSDEKEILTDEELDAFLDDDLDDDEVEFNEVSEEEFALV